MTWDHLHDEDVLYEFHGDDPDQLEPGRFYRGTVDGFADFGVFITLGESVTGLLHRSNVEGRLENLEWDAGDDVIVQVEGVRENGNVDLAWSIRQSDEEFRGIGTHDPDDGDATGAQPEEPAGSEPEPVEPPSHAPEPPAEDETSSPDEAAQPVEEAPDRTSVEIADVEERVGDPVRLVGRVEEVRQTDGPTIFTLEDPTGQIECAAFEAAGVRAFPEIDIGDVVAIEGRPERHRGDVQVETESIQEVPEDEREELVSELEAAEREQARPDATSLILADPAFEEAVEEIVEIATELRRAVFAREVIVIRHPPSVDGVVAAAGIEHGLRQLAARTFADGEATSWFVTRRPMEDPCYELGDAMYDVTDGEDRNDVVAVVGAGATEQDAAALDFLEVYDVAATVVDPLALPEDAAEGLVTPLAINIAGMIDEEVREDLVHLPAIAAGYDVPPSYRQLAREHGYEDQSVRERHEAIALISYYQRYDDKRELIADLLFDGEDAGDLAAHVAEQFRQRLETAVSTGEENATLESHDGSQLVTLDAASLTHRFTFPPRDLLADALRRETAADTVLVMDEDAAFVSTADGVDLAAIAAAVDGQVEQAAVAARRDRLTFLAGKREAVRDAIVDVLSA